MKKGIPILICLLFGACQSVPDHRADTDWADKTLYVTSTQPLGRGSFPERLHAIQKAKQDIAKQFEAQILALKTDSGKTVLEQGGSGNNREKVAAYVRRAEIVAIESTPKGVHLHARLFLGNALKALLDLLPYKEKNPPPTNSPGAM